MRRCSQKLSAPSRDFIWIPLSVSSADVLIRFCSRGSVKSANAENDVEVEGQVPGIRDGMAPHEGTHRRG
jgi:hypothetical protein